MTKESFVAIFKMCPNTNFIIRTNIAEGHGINGVDYTKFVGAWEGTMDKRDHRYNKVAGIMGDCVVIDRDIFIHGEHNNGRSSYYLPLENIVSVEMMDGMRPYGGLYPKSVATNIVDDL